MHECSDAQVCPASRHAEPPVPASWQARRVAVRFAKRARGAGGGVELELWPVMQHGFRLSQFLPGSGRAIESFARFVARFVVRCSGGSPAAAISHPEPSEPALAHSD